MDEYCYTASPRSLAAIVALRDALSAVCDTLCRSHPSTSNFNSLFSLLRTLNSCLARDTTVPSLTSCLLDSAPFRWVVADYILKQQGGYHHLGTHLIPSAGYTLSQAAATPLQDQQSLFDAQKKKLFEVASNARKMKASEIYDLARTCPDFFFVDQMKFYCGGAGRTCVDILMTRMAMSLDEAKRIATDYVREHTPPIDYREIFESLDDNCFGQKRLIPSGDEIESVFPDPTAWIGVQAFNELLEKAGITFEEFKTGFSDLSCANEWLRPFVRISGVDIHDLNSYNQLRFDPEHGCSWRLREPNQ